MAKKPLIAANWKSNKTISEALEWLEEFNGKLKTENGKLENVEMVIFSPFTALEPMRLEIEKLRNWEIKLGAQDISPFPDGPYTGEISARMLSDLVDYVLVGHSERRKHFGETTKVVGKKVEIAQKAGIIPIICAANFAEVPKVRSNFCLMYEPSSAISQAGIYRPDTPENAQKTLSEWRSKLEKADKFLYGGSVNPQNVAKFLAQPGIDGVVVGHASLDPIVFFDLITNVSS